MSHKKTIQVFVTRPAPAGLQLCEKIIAHRDLAIHCPLLTFKSRLHDTAITAQFEALRVADWVIFNSPQAVQESLPWILTHQLLHPALKVIAMGTGTRERLLAYGVSPVLVPTVFTSEGVLLMPELAAIAQQSIVIIKGEGGRAFLKDALCARAAIVTVIACYERVLASSASNAHLDLFNRQAIDVSIVTSGESLLSFKKIFSTMALPVPLIVPSERLARLARQLRFLRIWVAASATNDALFEVLMKNRDVLCRFSAGDLS